MKNNWQLRDFVFAGITGALVFATAFLLGSGIILATGIPATGGLVNIFAAVLLMTIAVRIVPKFGFATLAMAITFSIAIPTIVGGPPGAYKPIIGLLLGLTFDSIVTILKRTNSSHIIGGALASAMSITAIFFAMQILELPGVDKLQPLLKILIPIQALNGALGAWVGNTIFKKRLQNLPAVKRLINTDNVSN